MSDDEVVIRFVGENQVKPAADEAKEAVRGLEAQVKDTNATTQESSRSNDVFSASLLRFATPAAAAASATAAIAVGLAMLARESIDTAVGLSDMKTKTGLSHAELQRLGFVADVSGDSVEKYGDAVYKMGINVAKGTDATKAGVAAMGIEWDRFVQMSPEEKLREIVRHLDFTTNAEERNAAMAAIFGRNIDTVMVGLIKHYADAERSAVYMADGSIEALDRYVDFLKITKTEAMSFLQASMASFLTIPEFVLDQGVSQSWDNWSASVKAANGNLAAAAILFAHLSSAQQAQRRATEELTPAQQLLIKNMVEAGRTQELLSEAMLKGAVLHDTTRTKVLEYVRTLTDGTGTQRDYAAELVQAQKALRDLEPSTRANIAAALQMGESIKKVAEEVDVSEAVIRLFKEEMQESERAQQRASTEAAKHANVMARVRSASIEVTDAKRAEVLALRAQHLSESDIAAATKLTEVQVRAVLAAEKDRVDAAEASDKILREIEADRQKELQRLREAEQERGLARMKLETDLYDVFVKYDQDRSMIGLQGLARELQAIQISEDAAIAAAEKKYGTNVDLAAKEIAVIRERHQRERDLANGTADTVVERAAAAGYETRQQLRESADAARHLYEQMLASGQYTITALTSARDAWIEKEIAAAMTAANVWQRSFAQLPGVILGAIQGGGDVGRAAGAFLGTELAGSLASKGAAELIKSGHPMLGGALKSLAGPLGAIGGELAGALFGAMFGSAGRAEVEKFAATFDGGFAGLRQKLNTLGQVEAERLWVNLTQGVGKNNPEQAKKAIDAITQALERQEKTLQKYQVSWTDMSGAARDTALANILRELTVESHDLARAGLSNDAIVRKQADAYNQLLGEALRAGQDIPPAFLPVIRRMVELGEITDENRRLLLGLTDDGLPSLADMQAAMKTLGLEATDVGTRFGNLKFEEDARKYYQALQLLVDGGGDLKHMVGAMSEEVREFIAEGARMGREFSADMRPILEAMLEQGLLTDENGEKLKDLSGIRFSEPLERSVDRLIAKFDEWMDRVLGIPGAINQLPRSIDMDVNLYARRNGDWPEIEEHDTPAFATGGIAHGPLLARIEPGRKEIIGDVAFMTEAITGALDRLGVRNGAIAGGGGGGAEGGGAIQLNVYLGTEKLDERTIQIVNRGLQGQEIQVPETAIAGRTRP